MRSWLEAENCSSARCAGWSARLRPAIFARVFRVPSRLPSGRTARVLTETSMATERTARLQQYGETLAELRRYL
jgi:hypothetical protein